MWWKGMYYLQEILYPFWWILLGGYIVLVFVTELFNDYWYMFPFIGFWICVNRIIWWYSKKHIKPLTLE